jgi:hypothetical protein
VLPALAFADVLGHGAVVGSDGNGVVSGTRADEGKSGRKVGEHWR